MKMMNNKYPLEWLDRLILEDFNPNAADMSRLSEIDLTQISQYAIKESNRIQVRIKGEIFALRRKRQIRLLVRKYHSNLVFLLETMIERQKSSIFQMPVLSGIASVVVRCLDELLSFLEDRFSNYLSLDEKVPITYLLVSRKELQLKLESIQNRKTATEEMRQVLETVTAELAAALSLAGSRRVTFRQLLYERRLLCDLEQLDNSEDPDFFSALDHKLIGLNFNSPAYMALLKNRLASRLERQKEMSRKLSLLTYLLKEFNQIYSSDQLFFNAEVQHLKTVLGDWFVHERQYQEKQIELEIGLGQKDIKGQHKLECDLSADQIGLILRAADEARVVKSRSMSLVFQSIVPHLSTAFKSDLSYQSVRSKSYNAEDNDKNTAILALEKMIKKIRSYGIVFLLGFLQQNHFWTDWQQ